MYFSVRSIVNYAYFIHHAILMILHRSSTQNRYYSSSNSLKSHPQHLFYISFFFCLQIKRVRKKKQRLNSSCTEEIRLKLNQACVIYFVEKRKKYTHFFYATLSVTWSLYIKHLSQLRDPFSRLFGVCRFLFKSFITLDYIMSIRTLLILLLH